MKIKGRNLYILFTAFYAYFILALFESARGNFIPFFLNDFSIDNTSMGVILSVAQLGGVLGCFLAGNLSYKYGQKLTLIVGTTVCMLVCLSSRFISNAIELCIFYTVFTFGRCLLCISVDTLVPAITLGIEVLVVNFTHFMYACGSFVGQKIYGPLLENNVLWKTIYTDLGIIFFIALLLIIFIKQPTIHIEKSTPKEGKRELYKSSLIYIFIISFGFNAAGELLMTTWFINYMSNTYSYTPLIAAKYSSIFFMTSALGRLFGGMIIQKIGTMKGLKICIGSVAITVFVGLIFRQGGLILVALSGIFFSITYPTMVVLVNTTYDDKAPLALGIITTFNFMIDMSLNIFIGFLNDIIGNYLAFYLIPATMAVSLIALYMIDKKVNVTNNI